jgi:hypothetical protein
MTNATCFSVADVRPLVERARKAGQPPEDGLQGWSVSEMDPGRIVAVFEPAVRLRAGYVLRAYQFRSGGNGNGVVHAIPRGEVLAEPPKCGSDLFEPSPRPEHGLESILDALNLDKTPWSYLCMSLLGRELAEFGAIWHGVSWGAHTLIENMPWNERVNGVRLTEPEGWTGRMLRFDELRPRVELARGGAVVRFHTYCPVGMQRVIEHTDRYRTGKVTGKRRDVATGPAGIIF